MYLFRDFPERGRVELIEGEILEMASPGRRHRAFVNNLDRLLSRRLPEHARVSVQNPFPLSEDTEPQPDLAVLRARDIPYKDREASAEDACWSSRWPKDRWPTTARRSSSSTPRPASPRTG